jgi:hypothetical protein
MHGFPMRWRCWRLAAGSRPSVGWAITQAAARTLGLQLFVNAADSDLGTAFATFLQQRVGAVLVSGSSFFTRRAEQLAALAARHAVPALFPVSTPSPVV